MSTLELLLQQSLDSHSIRVVGLSFLGGVASTLLPCTVAMLPVLVGYIGGYARQSKKETFWQICLFIAGLALVMTAFGTAASLLGITFGTLIGSGWYYIIGLFSILMGLQLLDIVTIPLPQLVTRFPESGTGKILAPLAMGIAFGAASSPCGTPFLASILAFISREQNLILGGTSLLFYGLGQGTLLLAAGLFTGILKHLAMLRKIGSIITRLSALLFLAAGVMLIAQGAGLLFEMSSLFRLPGYSIFRLIALRPSALSLC